MKTEKVAGIEKDYQVREMTVSGLREHMILDQDVRSNKGQLLISKGRGLNSVVLERLRFFDQHSKIQEPIRVLVPRPGTKRRAD